MVGAKNILLVIPEMMMGGAQRSLAKLSYEFSAFANVNLVIFNHQYPVAFPVGCPVLSLDVGTGNSFISKIPELLR